MKPTVIEDRLCSFDIANYVEQARLNGRARLPPDVRIRACDLYSDICNFRAEHQMIPRELDETLEFAHRVLTPEWLLSHSEFPRYRSYTNIAVLNWYLGTVHRIPYQDIWLRCATAIRLLLRDLIALEVNSLAGIESRGMNSFDECAVRARILLLKEILAALSSGADIGAVVDAPPSAWRSYLSEPGSELAVIYLTALPLTQQHDEYLFLRVLHISECCFWGILTATLATIESLKRDDIETASKCLHVAPSVRDVAHAHASRLEDHDV